jgi:hypothetical protein
MVSTLELTAAVSVDAAGSALFLIFFFAFVVWVAAILAAARDAGILPAVYRVHRGTNVATFGGALLMVGPSTSLLIDESEIYSSMHCCGGTCTSPAARTLKLRSSSLRNGAGHQ